MADNVKVFLHVVYAGFGDASILEFESGGKRRFYLVDGGPVSYIGAGKPLENRIKKLEKPQLSRPYYQYLLYTLTRLTCDRNSKGREIKLDGAVVSHPHADHLDGVERLFRELLPKKYQLKVTPERPEKRLMCNGPVLLTRKFALQTEAYRSFSEFLLDTQFEVSLDEDDIQNAFGGNDMFFTFPSSPGVLYRRYEHSEDEEPSKEEQKHKLAEGIENEDDDLNKSSIILYIKEGGKICLTGDAHAHDITSTLQKHNAQDLDIIKIPHHGSHENSILGSVLPPCWAIHNLAAMLLLCTSLRRQVSLENYGEEEDDIKYLSKTVKNIAGFGNGEMVEKVADTFLETLRKKKRIEKTAENTNKLLTKVEKKHMEIVKAIQEQAKDPWDSIKPLEELKRWKDLKDAVVRIYLKGFKQGTERPVNRVWIDTAAISNVIKQLLGDANVFTGYFYKFGIDKFFDSFHAKTYYFSAEGRYRHPSPLVVKGIIKAAVKKKKPCRIVFTSGGCVPSTHLPDVNSEPFKGWKKLVSLYYLKGDVSFKLEPGEDVNSVPTGTQKFEQDDSKRSEVAEQLKKNPGFTIPHRSFLPELDMYCVTTTVSDKMYWLDVNGEGNLYITSTKRVLAVSNAPCINGDLRKISLKSEKGDETAVSLDKAQKPGYFVIKLSSSGYLFIEDLSLKMTVQKNKGTMFAFTHTGFSPSSKSGNQIPILEFLKSVGYKASGKAVYVRSVLEILIGDANMKKLADDLPSNFIAITTLDQQVYLEGSYVEISSSEDVEVVSGHIHVSLPQPSIKFDSQDVTRLEIILKDPSSETPSLSLLLSTSLRDIEFAVNLNKLLTKRQASVDMYLNALRMSLEGRDNLTLGALLDRVMGRLPLEALSSCFPSQLFEDEILSWKIDRSISTVNYFKSPLAVEVLSGDFFLIIPHAMNRIKIGETLSVKMSRIHVMVSDPRTYKSSFQIYCDADIDQIPVNVKMTCTPVNLPEVIISFPETVTALDVLKRLDQNGTLLELRVPFQGEVMKNLSLMKPKLSICQDVRGSKETRVCSVSFDFSFDAFPTFISTRLPLPEECKGTVTILNPLSSRPCVGLEAQFKLPIASSAEEKTFLDSKCSFWPIQVQDSVSEVGYTHSISLSPSSPSTTLRSALSFVIPDNLTDLMTASFPCISSILDKVLLNQISLEENLQSRDISSVVVSFTIPELTILEGKLAIYDANFVVEYANDQWYAQAETKVSVFNKFVCHAAFSLPKADSPGILTFENTDDLTFQVFVEGMGVFDPGDIPVVKELLSLKISKISVSFENAASSLRLTGFSIVVEKRKLTVGIIKLFNIKIGVTYNTTQEQSRMSFSVEGYLNSKTHASFAYNAEKRELCGKYQLTENISTSESLHELFKDETKELPEGCEFDQVKFLQVQEVTVILSSLRDEEWSLKMFSLSIQGSLSLGPFNLHKLRFEYTKEQAEVSKQHYLITGHFKSNDPSLRFIMELSGTTQQSKKNVFEAKEALLQFEVPFQLLKLDVVIQTNKTLTILQTPLIQLHEARLEYHLDSTSHPARTQAFIEGDFVIAQVRLKMRFMKDTKKGFILEGRLDQSDNEIMDFEKAAEQLSPGLDVKLPEGANVSLSSFSFKMKRNEEFTELTLEGESNGSWAKDAGFCAIVVENLGGKLHFRKERESNHWTGSVFLTGKVLLLQSVLVCVKIYHDREKGVLAAGTLQKPEQLSLEEITRQLSVNPESSTSWNEFVPEETESSLRSPHFKTASIYIDFAKKTLLLYGNVLGFGTGLLIIKRANANMEEPSEYGFLFGLTLGSDFRFSSINSRLSAVDDILSVQQANLSVISLKKETIDELRKDFAKLQDVKDPFLSKNVDVDVPFGDLDITSISKLNVNLQGIRAFAKINFGGADSKLLQNVTQIQKEEQSADVVLFAKLPENRDETEFMASIKEIKLFGGTLTFKEVTLSYRPFPNDNATFSLSGKMYLVLAENSNPLVFFGNLEISEFKAEFSMTAGGGPDKISQPFGMFGISFEQPELELTWKFDEDHRKPLIPSYMITGAVNFWKPCGTSEDPAATLRGFILFQKGRPVVAKISLDLKKPLSIDDVFFTLFGDNWPKGYLDVKFIGGRIYYSKSTVEVEEQEGKVDIYKEGFHGETHIHIFGYPFGVEITLNSNPKQMIVRGYAECKIDLRFVTLERAAGREGEVRGPEVVISRYDGQMEFSISAGVKLLQENIGTWSVGYNTKESCFLGSVTYDGELLGVQRPSIEFEWSKERGFKIRRLPALLDLEELINFAKAFEDLSEIISGPCEKLVGMAFDKAIKTKCSLNVKQVPVEESQKPDAWFALGLQGNLDIIIGFTDQPTLTVNFPWMVLAPDKPPKQFRLSDLKGFLIEQIVANSLDLVNQVFSDPEQLTKFFAALGTIKLSKWILSGLICRGVTSANVITAAEAALTAMETAAIAGEATLASSFIELLAAVEAAVSIAELAASAVTVIASVASVTSVLGDIVRFLKGIINFFTGKTEEKKEAEKRLEEAKEKGEEARKSVESRLVVEGLAITLSKSDEIQVTWKPLEKGVKYKVQIACIDLGGTEKNLSDVTTKDSKANVQNEAIKYNAVTLKASVEALYEHDRCTFTGKKQSLSVCAITRLHAPSKVEVESKQGGKELHVLFSQVKYAEKYKAEVLAQDSSVIGSAVLEGPADENDGRIVFRAQNLVSGPPGLIKVRVCAQLDRSWRTDNEFKYSRDLYRVAVPTNVCVSYKPASQVLNVEWSVTNVQDISCFLSEVVSWEKKAAIYRQVLDLKDADLSFSLQIPLVEVKARSETWYQLRVCSMGGPTALASAFFTCDEYLFFLRKVESISSSYDSQTDRLTVSWLPVSGAATYVVSIFEQSSLANSASTKVVDSSVGRVQFEMEDVELRAGLPYDVSVIANGNDLQHLASLPSIAGEEFTRLPRPASIILEYAFEDRKVRVSFPPVPNSTGYKIEVFNHKCPSQVAGELFAPNTSTEVTCSFDVDSMRFTSGATYKSRVTALGSATLINSFPGITATVLTCSESAKTVALKYSEEWKQLVVTFDSGQGTFLVSVEDVSMLSVEDVTKKKRLISTQIIFVKQSEQSVDHSVVEIPLNVTEEPLGARYQASVMNTGYHEYLPSGTTQSNEVLLLNPPDPVEQQYKEGVFTVTWKCVDASSGYSIRVYNSKTASTAIEENINSGNIVVAPAGKRMRKDFSLSSLTLESDGAYETVVQVLGDEVSIGGASAKSKTTIPSFSSPESVKIYFDNETRHMHVSCSIVKEAASFNLGVVDANKLNSQGATVQNALVGSKTFIVNKDCKDEPVEVEFDDSVLISSLDGEHKGVARVTEKQDDCMILPSGYSISEGVVFWLRPAVPIHMSFDPVNSILKITWTSVELAVRYLVDVLQTRDVDNGATTTLIPISKEVNGLSCDAGTEDLKIEETDKFFARVEPIAIQGTVIKDRSIACASEVLVCKGSPSQFDVLQVDDEAVKLRWNGDETDGFHIRVWNVLETGEQIEVITEHVNALEFKASAADLRMLSPGHYKFGVRTQGSQAKLHSVFKESDFQAVIMDAPIVNITRQSTNVTVQWKTVDNISDQDFSNYVISYLQLNTDLAWHCIEVGLSKTQETIDNLQADSEYLFCVSIASSKRGAGIRSPPTAALTGVTSVKFSDNLLDSPNFVPAQDWDETGHTCNIITEPWQLIQPEDKQYRLEKAHFGLLPPGFELEGMTSWFVQASNACCWRVQTIYLLAKGFTEEYLDEVKPDIHVSERFAIKKDQSGTFEMKVSLLDANKRDLPGENFFYSGQLPHSMELQLTSKEWMWNSIGHTFSDYPAGLRFIRFEDVMQSGASGSGWKPGSSIKGGPGPAITKHDNWTDARRGRRAAYDVKACGASVKIAQSSS